MSDLSSIAALFGDPARAEMLVALMDGRALTGSELAHVAGVGLPTASGHLAKLEGGGLLAAEKQGRHRYFRLAGPEVARVIEALMGLARRAGGPAVETGPRDAALRQARVCYDHLAGERGVALLQGLARSGWIADAGVPQLTGLGRAALIALGVDIPALEQARRPLCRHCLDWSERRGHLGGALGAALLEHVLRSGWARRGEGRALHFTPEGLSLFEEAFGL